MQILLADDHSLVRTGILSLLQYSLQVKDEIYEAASCKELLQQLTSTVDITHLIADIQFADGSILDVLPQIRASSPNVKILILSMQAPGVYQNTLKKYDVFYFLSKGSDKTEAVRVLREFLFEEQPLFDYYSEEYLKSPFSNLTSKELRVLSFWLKEYPTKNIALEIGVKPSTISITKSNILEKLHVDSFKKLCDLAKIHNLS